MNYQHTTAPPMLWIYYVFTVYDREGSHLHCVPVNGVGGGGGGCRGRGLWLHFWLMLGWEGLFGAGHRWFYFQYVSKGQNRTKQRPQFTLHDRLTADVTDSGTSIKKCIHTQTDGSDQFI